MTLPIKNRSTAILLATAVSGIALAGTTLATPKPGQPGAPSEPPPVVGKATIGLEVTETEVIATGWRASKLTGADVENDKKEKIGKVDDLVIAPDGSLSVATIETGGFLGMGSHRVAIPMRQLVLGTKDPKVVLPGGTKDALKKLPEFKYSK